MEVELDDGEVELDDEEEDDEDEEDEVSNDKGRYNQRNLTSMGGTLSSPTSLSQAEDHW